MSKYLSQSLFMKGELYRGLKRGSYSVSYSDSTHIPENEWRSLLKLEVDGPEVGLVDDHDHSFALALSMDPKFKGKNRAVVLDTLSLAATRLGLLAPKIEGETVAQLAELRKSKGIVLIPDTNSLYNGTLHWLLNVLRESSVWLLPFVMSLTQIQMRDANLKSLIRKYSDNNLPQALRSRALVNSGLGLLERNHYRYQVMELDPSLMRYMRNGKNGFDSDESDILEDRLLIEGIHSILRSTRTRADQLVVTSDVLLARVLSAEGIPNLCLPPAQLGEEPVSNFRYDPWSRSFTGTTLGALLWDLVHAFSSITVKQTDPPLFTVSCYWPGKMPRDWLDERLEVVVPDQMVPQAGPQLATQVNDKKQDPKPDEGKPAANAERVERAAAKPALPAKAKPAQRATAKPASAVASPKAAPAVKTTFSDAAIPQSSLPLALRVASVIYDHGRLAAETFINAIPEDWRPNHGNTWRALEVLRLAKVIDFDGTTISARPELDLLDSNLRAGRLDDVSRQLENFEAYAIVMNELRRGGAIDRGDIRDILSKALNQPVALEASIRLVRYHVLLGQCWTDQNVWRDGSRRPDEEEFVRAVAAAFEKVAHDNIARISDLLPALCSDLHMSPWACADAIRNHARALFSQFTFQYAVGGKPRSVDQVLQGSLKDLNEVAVPLDRVEIGGRPALTMGRVRS